MNLETINSQADFLRIRRARVHNLKNLDVDIPQGRLVAITGPSGSGKSTLAFDTIYAEAQRQYLQTLAPHVRRLVPQLDRPDVDLIEGLLPTIAVDQRPSPAQPRSTVGTLTEVYDFLRLLFARVGMLHCPQCDIPLGSQTPQDICSELLLLPEGTKLMILAPMVRLQKGQHQDVFRHIQKQGFPRARVDGVVVDVENPPTIAAGVYHNIEAVVDRLVIRPGIESRLKESVQLALKLGEGVLLVSYEDRNSQAPRTQGPRTQGPQTWIDRLFSTSRHCPGCNQSYPEPQPRLFSFNSPYGACPQCEGLGVVEAFDVETVFDFHRGLGEGAVRLWENPRQVLRHHEKKLLRLMQEGGFSWDTPLSEIPEPYRGQLLLGVETAHTATALTNVLPGNEAKDSPRRSRGKQSGFVGLLHLLEVEYQLLADSRQRHHWAAYRKAVTCPECHGTRLGPVARSVRVGPWRIHQLAALCVPELKHALTSLELSPLPQMVAAPIVKEITQRLEFLENVGLDYLTIDRSVDSLSGGELQRVRLAAGLGAGLSDICYVLDEPSVGLHPRDTHRLIETLRALTGRGNTVIVVEHDESLIRAADWVIDIGPGAGRDGGSLVAKGTVDEVARNHRSPTGRYLAGLDVIPMPSQRRTVDPSRCLRIVGVTTNNLKDITVEFPLGVLACVTGVSGSGKSSLMTQTFLPALRKELTHRPGNPGPYQRIENIHLVERVIEVDQSPIGRSPRSNAATYTGIFDEIRKVFAETKEARRLGFTAARFSFNTSGGRCEVCEGLGYQKVEMDFLPDFYVTCPECQGKRFNRQTLEVRYRGKTIAEVLALPVAEALPFFENFPTIDRILTCLDEVGLGYLALGQPANTLSGGEAQRVKLAAELGRVQHGKTVYVLDEPTTGLHFQDIGRLLRVLQRLVDVGNTVIVVEHHLDVIKSADWIIDLGPEGGQKGGQVVAVGPPEAITHVPTSYTGQFLRRVMR